MKNMRKVFIIERLNIDGYWIPFLANGRAYYTDQRQAAQHLKELMPSENVRVAEYVAVRP